LKREEVYGGNLNFRESEYSKIHFYGDFATLRHNIRFHASTIRNIFEC